MISIMKQISHIENEHQYYRSQNFSIRSKGKGQGAREKKKPSVLHIEDR